MQLYDNKFDHEPAPAKEILPQAAPVKLQALDVAPRLLPHVGSRGKIILLDTVSRKENLLLQMFVKSGYEVVQILPRSMFSREEEHHKTKGIFRWTRRPHYQVEIFDSDDARDPHLKNQSPLAIIIDAHAYSTEKMGELLANRMAAICPDAKIVLQQRATDPKNYAAHVAESWAESVQKRPANYCTARSGVEAFPELLKHVQSRGKQRSHL